MAKYSLLREEARRAWRELRGSELSAGRTAVAVAIGLFIGSQPIFGCHTPLVLLLCLWFRLDAAIAWVAANISNPLFAPALLTAEFQVGAYLRTGRWLRLHEKMSWAQALSEFPEYMLLGAPVVGLALAALGGGLVFALVALKRRRAPSLRRGGMEPYRLPEDAPPWVHAIERVAARYSPQEGATPAQRTRFHYVRFKLLGDPVARLIADIAGDRPGALGEVLDIGTGAGQLPILLLELGRAARSRGFDWDRAKIEDARRASGGNPGAPLPPSAEPPGSSGEQPAPQAAPPLAAEFWCADAREAELGDADTVLLIDLLHYFRVEEQDAIVRRAAAAVRPGGRLLVREADTERGLRSSITLLEERIFTALRFNRGERVRFRPAREIVALLEQLGFSCETRPAWGKTPFSNVLIVGTRADR
ncbi:MULTISPECIES: DUF2062 domain-containing protein [Sorangium]|uniref:DUF2062 domain-containing protein n=1 Tax=Sorangium cellulosum TaxID=56 RepID=A0A4P2R166_SORCE|nr:MULTISPECIES: DUF2062 domain-containing protein [Sorangium]AUX36694.1 hypothetical protein SOCE836_089030 [Sorangium cellulosum]WCQ95992.1 hypothetical protein NQZ70_08769 [Sorangium sp. Soce836]